MVSLKYFPFKYGAHVCFAGLLMFLLTFHAKGSVQQPCQDSDLEVSAATTLPSGFSPSPALITFKKHIKDSRRIIAACLAFPLPLGFIGVHRVFLGTRPYVPVIYIATLGGCLGIIPFVDFCAILFSPDLEQYIGNPRIFMWIK